MEEIENFGFFGTDNEIIEAISKIREYANSKAKEIDDHGRQKYLMGIPVIYDDGSKLVQGRLKVNRKARRAEKAKNRKMKQ